MANANTALITGASSGMGKELARIHAQQGGNLVLVARSKDKLENLKTTLENEYAVSVAVIAQDLSQPEAAKQIFEQTKEMGL